MPASASESTNRIPKSPRIHGLTARANSLFWNILRVKSLFSIFCRTIAQSDSRKSNKTRILWNSPEKNVQLSPSANSLFNNILPINYFVSIFCSPYAGLSSSKSKKTNTLSLQPRKNRARVSFSIAERQPAEPTVLFPDLLVNREGELARMTAR